MNMNWLLYRCLRRLNQALLFYALVLITYLPGSSAWACTPQLDIPHSALPTVWELDALAQGLPIHQLLDVRVRELDGCGPLFLTAALEGAENIRIRASANGPLLSTDGLDGQSVLPVLPSAAGAALQPLLEWDPLGQWQAPGPVQVEIIWRLYRQTALLPELILESRSQWSGVIPAVYEVNVRTPQGSHSISVPTIFDLGELRSGASYSLDLEWRGNANVFVSLDAQYGRLRSSTRPDVSIPYELRYAGRTLNGPIALPRSNGTGRAQLQVILGSVERRVAGEYADVLTLTIQAE